MRVGRLEITLKFSVRTRCEEPTKIRSFAMQYASAIRTGCSDICRGALYERTLNSASQRSDQRKSAAGFAHVDRSFRDVLKAVTLVEDV